MLICFWGLLFIDLILGFIIYWGRVDLILGFIIYWGAFPYWGYFIGGWFLSCVFWVVVHYNLLLLIL